MRKVIICLVCLTLMSGSLASFVYASAPTYSVVTTDKAYYEPGEYVKFTMSSDGSSNTLWVYYPDGSSKYVQNAGSSYIMTFSSTGEYKALVEGWNGDGSYKSAKISFHVVDVSQIQQVTEVNITPEQYKFFSSLLTYIGGFMLFFVVVVLCYFGYKFFRIFF